MSHDEFILGSSVDVANWIKTSRTLVVDILGRQMCCEESIVCCARLLSGPFYSGVHIDPRAIILNHMNFLKSIGDYIGRVWKIKEE